MSTGASWRTFGACLAASYSVGTVSPLNYNLLKYNRKEFLVFRRMECEWAFVAKHKMISFYFTGQVRKHPFLQRADKTCWYLIEIHTRQINKSNESRKGQMWRAGEGCQFSFRKLNYTHGLLSWQCACSSNSIGFLFIFLQIVGSIIHGKTLFCLKLLVTDQLK